jgi:hypothetical protein
MPDMLNSEVPFCFPVKQIENSRLILTPFNHAFHAEQFVEGCKSQPDLFAYLPYGPFETTVDFATWYNSRIGSTNSNTLFAILVKPESSDQQNVVAGIIGLLDANTTNDTVEIGFVCVIGIVPGNG